MSFNFVKVRISNQDDVSRASEYNFCHAAVVNNELHLYNSLSFYDNNYVTKQTDKRNISIFIKNDSVWDKYLHNTNYDYNEIADSINYQFNIMLWENLETNGTREQFDYIKHVCEPAFDRHILDYDEENDEIYSQGPNSFLYKVRGISDKVTLIKNIKLGSKYVSLIGNDIMDMPISFLKKDTIITFINNINRAFPN